MEFKKLISYRVDFWVQFVASVLIEFGVSYFLWKAIFEYKEMAEIGGFTFHSMMFYYLLVALAGRLIRGPDQQRQIANEIYEGSLNRYLIYPVDFLVYRFVAVLANFFVGLVQLVIGVGLFLVFWGLPSGIEIGPSSLAAGFLAILFATFLHYIMAACLEMVAFWADGVWSLMVMLRFLILFFGGGFIPLALFPSWAQSIAEILPFAYVMSFPVRATMGLVGTEEFLTGFGMLAAWSMVFSLAAAAIWSRGTRVYSGVGI